MTGLRVLSEQIALRDNRYKSSNSSVPCAGLTPPHAGAQSIMNNASAADVLAESAEKLHELTLERDAVAEQLATATSNLDMTTARQAAAEEKHVEVVSRLAAAEHRHADVLHRLAARTL